jgi:hypothetical protein
MKPLDLTGQRFGRLIAERIDDARHQGRIRWRCRCDCGEAVDVLAKLLRNGHTQSCGCLSLDVHRASNSTHGGSSSSEFRIWVKMRARCNDPKSRRFARYGGRGIAVCTRWDESFAAFLADVGRRPRGFSIDRIDNDGNYEPGNVRWAAPKEQNRNRSDNHKITVDDTTLTIAEWAERSGVAKNTLYGRIGRGMSPEEAIRFGRINRAKR